MLIAPWVSCFRGAPRPQSMLLHTVLQEPLTDACAVAVPKGVCWSCCPSISMLYFLFYGGRAHM